MLILPTDLKNIISALNALKKGRLITLFGCGGGHDKGKRDPEMGKLRLKTPITLLHRIIPVPKIPVKDNKRHNGRS